jgi:site-specific recombinase XerD
MARPTTKVRRVEVEGPLAPFAAAYRSRLREAGYTPLTIAHQLGHVARLSRWMQATQVAAHELTTARVEQFLALRRPSKGHRACFQGLLSLLAVLVERAVSSEGPAPAPPESGRDAILARFHTYLLAERGLAVCTARAYVDRARRFLDGCADDSDLADLRAGDVTRAVQREVARVSVGSAQYFVAGLRSFLRFCFVEGLVGADLGAAALAVTGRRRSPLPKGISEVDATALLGSCDRRRSDGRRDLGVLFLLLRLGLRAGEVAGLTLDDIDWRAGEIVVRGKGRREDRLPLPVDVGEAIARYLQRGRQKTARRELFLRSLAPVGALHRGGVSSIVRHACRRAGIAPVGAHRLRHTLACTLVAADAGLGEIGELLRHRGVTSTAIYARVDIETLRTLAQPWPGGEQR